MAHALLDGLHDLNGHPVPLLPPGIRVPEPVVFGLANHNIYEYTRLKSLLPLVYEEFGSRPPEAVRARERDGGGPQGLPPPRVSGRRRGGQRLPAHFVEQWLDLGD